MKFKYSVIGICGSLIIFLWSSCSNDKLGSIPRTDSDNTDTQSPIVSSTLTPLLPPGGALGGLTGGHFDLDTSHLWYKTNSGTTDFHVHDYSSKYNINGADFFNLLDGKLGEIYENITDASQTFKLIISNAELSSAGVLNINGKLMSVGNYQDSIRSNAPDKLQIYSLGVSTSSSVSQLRELKISFPINAIEKSGIVPTVTSCVRTNKAGAKGEYRDGALIVQAVNSNNFKIDPKTFTATQDSGLLWEATIFWHWNGPCY